MHVVNTSVKSSLLFSRAFFTDSDKRCSASPAGSISGRISAILTRREEASRRNTRAIKKNVCCATFSFCPSFLTRIRCLMFSCLILNLLRSYLRSIWAFFWKTPFMFSHSFRLSRRLFSSSISSTEQNQGIKGSIFFNNVLPLWGVPRVFLGKHASVSLINDPSWLLPKDLEFKVLPFTTLINHFRR